MANADRVTKRVVFQLDTDLKKINREIDSYEQNLKSAKWAEAEAKAQGDQVKLGLIAQRRAVDELKEQRKKAQVALKQYNATQEKHSSLMSQGLDFLKSSVAGYLAIGASIYKAVGYFKDLAKAGEDWEGTVGALGPQTQKLADSIGNLISQKDLSRLVEYQNQLGLTEKETNAVAQAAIQYGRLAKLDFGAALKQVTDSVIGGQTKALQRLGFRLDDVAGTKTEKRTAILKSLAIAFGDSSTQASNASEQAAAYANKLSDVEGKVGSQITQSAAYRKTVEAVSAAQVGLVEHIGYVIDQYQYLGKEIRRFWDWLDETDYRITDFVTRSHNTLTLRRAKNTEAEVEGLKRSVKAYDDFTAQYKMAQAKLAAELAAYDDEQRKKDLKKTVKHHSKKKAKFKDEYDANLKTYKQYIKDQQAQSKREELYEKKLAAVKESHLKQRLDIDKRLQASAKKAAEKDKTRLEREKESHQQRIEMIQQHTDAFFQAATANALSASSFGGFMQAMAGDTLRYLGQIAQKKAAFYAAEALAAAATLNWGSAAQFTAAAVAMEILGAGMQYVGGNVGSSSPGGGAAAAAAGGDLSASAAANSNYRESSISSARESERRASAPGVVYNIYVKGRSDLLTRKDLQNVGKKLAQGRA